jgi:hypothetical protein
MSLTSEAVLLAPVEIWEVMLDNSTIKFFEPLVVKPEILPPEEPGDKTYLTVDVSKLAISSFGVNMEELESAIRSDIRFAWRHFVMADDNQLTSDANVIKKNYLALAEAIDE